MNSKVDDKKIKDLIHTIGLNNYLVDAEIKKIVESQFRLTYEVIKDLNLQALTEEELLKVKTNFIYKSIGKLYTSPEVIRKNNQKEIILKQKKNEREEFESRRSVGVSKDLSGTTII